MSETSLRLSLWRRGRPVWMQHMVGSFLTLVSKEERCSERTPSLTGNTSRVVADSECGRLGTGRLSPVGFLLLYTWMQRAT